MRIILRQFWRARQGVAAIEMALIFPIFLLFFMGMFEMGLIWFGNAVISNSVYNAVRESSTGCVGSGHSPGTCTGDIVEFEELKDRISAASVGLVDPDRLCIATKTLEEINNPNDVTSPGTQLDLGQGNQVRVFYAGYNWPVFFPYLRYVFGNATSYRTYQVIRNENFGDATLLGTRTGAAQNCPPPT